MLLKILFTYLCLIFPINSALLPDTTKVAKLTYDKFWTRLRDKRNDILKIAQKNKSDAIEKFMPLWQEAGEYLRAENYEEIKTKPNHFTRTAKSLTEYVYSIIANILASSLIYKQNNINLSDIGILDLALPEIPQETLKFLYVSPMFVGPDPNEELPSEKTGKATSDVVYFLRKKFPKSKHILFFNPLFFPTLESLGALIGHELAHLTQPYRKGIGEIDDFSISRLAEIDADIKNICFQEVNGNWILRKNSKDIISNSYAFLEYSEIKIYKIYEELIRDLGSKKEELIKKYFKPLLTLYFLRHPSAKDRKFIMQEFIKTMEDFGNSMSDDEFNAVIGIITIYDCLENNIKLSPEFLKIIKLEKAKNLSRIVKNIKIPEINKSFP